MKKALLGLASAALAFLLCPVVASAQSLPVQVSVEGNTVHALIGNPAAPAAEVNLVFDDASNLSATSLGLSARLVDVNDPNLLSRLPDPTNNPLPSQQPLLITIEPPSNGGLSFRGTGSYELHTHALPYMVGSSLRVFKAPLNGAFRDTTESILPGSVRARSRYDGFSQFLVLTDLRPTRTVVAEKIANLRTNIGWLPSSEQSGFTSLVDDLSTAVSQNDYTTAIATADQIISRAQSRAAAGAIANEWRATRDVHNDAGALVAGAVTLKFSLAFLRDYGI